MSSTAGSATFGLVGLGVMGRSLALNLCDHGERVLAFDLEAAARERAAGEGLTVAPDLPALAAGLARPRRLLVMVPAGDPVDAVLATLAPHLEPDDVVIDGGNSRWQDTERRERELSARGLHFVGMGVSGGEEGARRGPSLMPGGSRHAWEQLAPTLEAIAARTAAGPCVTHVGPGGAGHFVKIVHNGIEYADMQLLAEAYDLLARVAGLTAPALAETFRGWNEGPLESFLTELTAGLFEVRDPVGGGPLVEAILDRAGQKGTGRWTLEAALELGVAVPTIGGALDARVLSSRRALRQRVAPALRLDEGDRTFLSDPDFSEHLGRALLAARVCAYAQGFDLLRAASLDRGWDLRLDELARIWQGGCIIRARLLETVRAAWSEGRDPESLLLDPAAGELLADGHGALRRVVGLAQEYAIPVPALGASLAWLDAMRSPRLPQNLIQAQRDAFGAHGYQRLDDPEGPARHTEWS